MLLLYSNPWEEKAINQVAADSEQSSNLGNNSLSAEGGRSAARHLAAQAQTHEKVFGWSKQDSQLRQVKLRGLERGGLVLRLAMGRIECG